MHTTYKAMPSDEELVEFARKQNKKMGSNLAILLKFGVVGIVKEWEFTALVNHLQTNRDFELITGFEYNREKGLIWLDRNTEEFKKTLRHKYK